MPAAPPGGKGEAVLDAEADGDGVAFGAAHTALALPIITTQDRSAAIAMFGISLFLSFSHASAS